MESNSLSPLGLLKRFCESDYVERNADKAAECLSMDIHWFGTSDEEDVQNLDEARAYMEEEIGISPAPYQITFSDERERAWGDGFGIASVKMKIAADGLIMQSRITCMTKNENGQLKICEMHTSIPEGHQEQGEYFPFEFARQHESDVLHDFVNTMLPGGIFGMELGEGFPLAIVNQNMLLYLGYRNELEYMEAIDGRLANAVHPDDRGLLRAAVLDTMDQGDEFKALLRIRKSNGSYFWGDIKGVRSRDIHGSERIVCLCLDATNLVLANDQLKDDRIKLEEYASKLMEKEEIIQKDARQMRRMRQWFGTHTEDMDTVQKEHDRKLHVNWKQMAAIIISVMFIIAPVSGYLITMVPYDAMQKESSGMAWLAGAFVVVILLAAVLLMIYNNRIVRTKLREREYRNTLFRLLAENVDSVFLVFDHESGEVEYVSENIERILGYESREILNHGTRTIPLPFDADELERIRMIMKDKKNFYLDFPYSNPGTGKQQLLRLSGYVPDGSDWQKKWIFCVSDRTDEVLKERRLEQAVREADEASKAKSEFLANMSHDIRTPMNGIIGMTQLALQDGTGEEAMKNYLRKISTSSGFLLTLINDILDMSKIESGIIELHPKAYSMKELRRYLESVILPLAGEKQIDFQMNVDETVTVLADQQRFNQILFNLLSNAVKYTDQNGTVSLTVRGRRRERGMIHLMIRVEDNGVGMSPEFQKQMFKSFTQERRKAMGMSGTGLGLAIVKRLVDLMKGTIHVESGIGKGSIFVIEMDVPAAETPCEKEPAADAGSASGEPSARILLCEDNAINQEIMLGILEFLGLQADLAVDGKKGVEAFRRRKPGYYSAILMDLRMPVMDGYEATRTIRAMERPDAGQIPIIALTADAFEEDRKRCLDAGMNDFLAKPVEIKVLKEMLGRYLRKEKG